MKFEDARRKALRWSRNEKIKDKELQRRMVESITNQARLHEGERAAKEIKEELNYKGDTCLQPRHGWSRHYAKRYEEIFKKKV